MPAGIDPDEYLTRLKQTRDAVLQSRDQSDVARATGRLLGRIEASLSRPLRITVLGEINSGKTSVANRLLGSDLLTTDVICNTRVPVVVKYSRQPQLQVHEADGSCRPITAHNIRSLDPGQRVAIEVGIPLERLLRLEIADTPGLAGEPPGQARWPALRRPNALAIWCTIATQAWRASEVAHWQALDVDPAHSLLVVTRSDLLQAPDREKVLHRLQQEAGLWFRSIILVPPGDLAGPGSALSDAVDAAAREIRAHRCRRAATIIHRHLELIEGRVPQPTPAWLAAS